MDLNIRLSSMHTNKMKNVKAKCEMLYQVLLKEKVVAEEQQHVPLETHLIIIKRDHKPLFLGAEQGLGEHSDHVLVIVNLRAAPESRKRLAAKHKEESFRTIKPLETSVEDVVHKEEVEN